MNQDKMRRIKIALHNAAGGELDSVVIDWWSGDEMAINGALVDMIEDSPLHPGDQIIITEEKETT